MSLGPADVYVVKIAADGDAYVDLLSGASGSPYASPRLRGPTSEMKFGPYGVDAVIRVRSEVGTTTYDVPAPASGGSGLSSAQLANLPLAQRDVNNRIVGLTVGSETVIGTAFSFVDFFTASAGTTLQTTWAVPPAIVDRGGYIYVDASAGGGGGGGGSTDAGGGGGGAARASVLLPVYVPSGTTTLYIQAGAGGAGGAGNGAGVGSSGSGGAESYIKRTSHTGPYLLRHTGGLGGAGAPVGAGGAGGFSSNYSNIGGTAGAAGNPGANSPGAGALITQSGAVYTGGAGGGGGGTAGAGGGGGASIAQAGNAGAGAGSGGGGGAGPWGRSGGQPFFGQSGSGGGGGAGGGTPAAGVTAFNDSFGGGGGGGGKGMAGGAGGDGFVRIAY